MKETTALYTNGHSARTLDHPAPLHEQNDLAVVAMPNTRESPASATKTIRELLSSGKWKLSVIVPLLNEEDSLPDLYSRVKAALEQYAPNHEIIFVDDGSRDNSYAVLQGLWRKDTTITLLRFRRNYGKAAALSAGFEHMNGDMVMMMDADLQDQPEELPNLIECLDRGYDLVTGWKRRRHDPLGKTLPSKLFNRTVAGYFKINIHDFNCGLKLMKASVAKDLLLYGDFHRFIPVLAAHKGYRVTECAVEHAARVHGVSKYGAKRLVTGMFDFGTSVLMTKFYTKPMHLFGTAGLIVAGLGVLIGLFLVFQTIFGESGHLRPLWIVMTVMLLGGIQLICAGLLAEMMTNHSHRATPSYSLSEVLEAKG